MVEKRGKMGKQAKPKKRKSSESTRKEPKHKKPKQAWKKAKPGVKKPKKSVAERFDEVLAAKETAKKVKEQKEPKVEKLPPQKDYYTNVDRLFSVIESEGKISLKDLALKLNLAEDKIEEWTKVLDKKAMIDTKYPIVGSIIFTKIGYVETKESKKKSAQHHPEAKAEPKKKRKIPILLIIIFAILLIFSILFVILIQGGYLVIE